MLEKICVTVDSLVRIQTICRITWVQLWNSREMRKAKYLRHSNDYHKLSRIKQKHQQLHCAEWRYLSWNFSASDGCWTQWRLQNILQHSKTEVSHHLKENELGEVCMSMDQHAWPDRTTPFQSVCSMALSTMMVECEWSYYLFINYD